MKNKRGLLYVVLMLVILLILCMFIFIIVAGLYIMTLIINREKNKRSRFREKLFNSLVKSSDTVYIMMDENKHALYVSSNVEDILGEYLPNVYP